MKKILQMKNSNRRTLLTLVAVVILLVAGSFISPKESCTPPAPLPKLKFLGSEKFAYGAYENSRCVIERADFFEMSGMTYVVFDKDPGLVTGGISVINLTKETLEIEYYKKMLGK